MKWVPFEKYGTMQYAAFAADCKTVLTIRPSINDDGRTTFRCIVDTAGSVPQRVHVAPSLAAAKTWLQRRYR